MPRNKGGRATLNCYFPKAESLFVAFCERSANLLIDFLDNDIEKVGAFFMCLLLAFSVVTDQVPIDS